MNEQKVIGEVFEVIVVNGKMIVYVEVPMDTNFNENDKVEINLVERVGFK